MVEQVADQLETAAIALNLRRDELADIELQLLLDALLRYGACDLRCLNQSVLRRRVADAMRLENLPTISALLDRLLHDERALVAFLSSIRGSASQLFAQPSFFRAFITAVVPLLRTYSFVRIWVPTTGPGGDAYSLAALLDQAGILSRTIIYATSINDVAVTIAKAGLYKHTGRELLENQARSAGLEAPLERYFDVHENMATPKESLREGVMFARHNPAADASINEFHAIVCRGLLPQLNAATQLRLHTLFFDSLLHLGFLALGNGETLAHTPHEAAFRHVSAEEPIYRRLR
ncbi:MAG TPA: CheR family methyltransferase [Candidatus Acidoferrales bacterium]|nr:CheR family methyltransferase [Candidatus Acidoferrales bacterium]